MTNSKENIKSDKQTNPKHSSDANKTGLKLNSGRSSRSQASAMDARPVDLSETPVGKDGKPLIKISRRELFLRERLAAVQEDLVYDERHLRVQSNQRRTKLIRKINKARARQEARLDRRDSSKIYAKSHIIYYLLSPFFAIGRFFRGIYYKLQKRVDHHRAVTPHRSFYLTTRGKSIRQIKITGYFRFIGEVWRFIWENKWLFTKFVLLYTLILSVVIGMSSQESYTTIREALSEADLQLWLQVPALFVQGLVNATSVGDATRQPIFIFTLVMGWLVLIFLIRHLYNGQRLKLRDGLYNAGAPIIPAGILAIVIIVQMLPMSLAMMVYSSLTNAGLINSGVRIENMAAWCALTLVAVLTIYWMITSVLCMVTITLPGIYPLRAYFETSKLVSGRRVKILMRVLVMFLPLMLMWLLLLTPFVVLDIYTKTSLPIVLMVSIVLVAMSLVWAAAYVYMLYRRILDSPEQPIGKTSPRRFVWPWIRREQLKVAKKTEANGDSGANKHK